MKRILSALIALALACSVANAAGTCTVSEAQKGPKYIVTVSCTADAADGSFPDTAFGANIDGTLQGRGGYKLVNVIVDPGSTAPTPASDLQLQNANSWDVLCGAGTNKIDDADTVDFYPVNSAGDYRYYSVTSDLTQVISGNSVNSAVVAVDYIFEPIKR